MRALLFLLCSARLAAQSASGTLISATQVLLPPTSLDVSTAVTSTQAKLSYQCAQAATVEVSESASYTPLVHDVDTALFAGSNLDSRASSANDGTSHVFVVGSRLVGTALDTLKYSRALQANTLHYYRVTCGGSVAAGTFTTNNIPVGSTFNEPYPADPSTPGGWLTPTLSGVRTQTIVDPQTGALLSPVSIPSDHLNPLSGSAGMTLNDGARVHNANPALHSDSGTNGYLLNISDQVGFYSLYFLNPANGAAKHLGSLVGTQQSATVDDNLKAYPPAVGSTLTEYAYTGAYAPQANHDAAPFDDGTIYTSTSLGALISAYDSSFDAAKFLSCSLLFPQVTRRYTVGKCARGDQDSYGWIWVFDKNTKTIIAAWNTYAAQASKFCAIHEFAHPWPTVAYLNWHGLNLGNTTIGTAGVETTLASGASAGATTITTTGNPVNQASGGDPVATPTTTVGDVFRVVGDAATVRRITAKSGNNWTFTPALSNPVSSGAKVYMDCNAPHSSIDDVWGITYWDFINDPHGTDITGTTIITDTAMPGGGHDDLDLDHPSAPTKRVAETTAGWAHYPGSSLSSVNQAGVLIDSFAAYNGITPPGFGVLLTRHPSYQQTTGDPWFMDYVGFNGGDPDPGCSIGRYYSACTGATLVSGSLYKYVLDSRYPLHRKLIPTQASTGGSSLFDISSATTGNVIGTGAGDNYKYCVAYKANECRTGSTAGDIFFNVPALDTPYCKAHNGPYPPDRDICITDTPLFSSAVAQIYMGTTSADSLSKTRIITNGLAGPKAVVGYPLAKTLPDASRTLFTIGAGLNATTSPVDVWQVKMTPLPAPDGQNRTGYLTRSVTVPAGLYDNVLVKFGYEELGGNCGTRNDSCYATGATIPAGNNPYFYALDGASGTLATLSGRPCSTGCTVAVPVISGRMARTNVVGRGPANVILAIEATVVYNAP